jgi:hypothetical protein
VAAYYGVARACEHLGQADKAAAAVQAVLGTPQDWRARILLADEFNTDGEFGRGAEMAQAVLNQDPQHLAALLRLGDSQKGIARHEDRLGVARVALLRQLLAQRLHHQHQAVGAGVLQRHRLAEDPVDLGDLLRRRVRVADLVAQREVVAVEPVEEDEHGGDQRHGDREAEGDRPGDRHPGRLLDRVQERIGADPQPVGAE